jgi:7-carboxy-7-deazaguanine synthase
MGNPNLDSDVQAMIRLNEKFGPTIQGEGPYQGRPAAFLRVSGCNLTCKWCDTPYTWDWEGKNGTPYSLKDETHLTPVENIVDWLAGFKPNVILVVSGGEPMLQQVALAELWPLLNGRTVQIETNGTRPPSHATVSGVDRFVVSPHYYESAGVHGIKPDALRALEATGKASFKFVVATHEQGLAVQAIVNECKLTDVWVMPEGDTPERLSETTPVAAAIAIENGWNLSTRLHTLIWGKTRGV